MSQEMATGVFRQRSLPSSQGVSALQTQVGQEVSPSLVQYRHKTEEKL